MSRWIAAGVLAGWPRQNSLEGPLCTLRHFSRMSAIMMEERSAACLACSRRVSASEGWQDPHDKNVSTG